MLIKVVDRNERPIVGANVRFFVGPKSYGGCRTGSNGVAHIEVSPPAKAIKVSVEADGHRKEQVIDGASGTFTFQFEEIEREAVPTYRDPSFIELHFPGLTGIAFLLLAIFLAFKGETNIFQQRIILATFALAGAGLATELTGFLQVHLSFGSKLAIQAGGALAVFIVLYLLVPAQ